ncbi:MAG: 30S ribosomal protein S1 [Acidobacteria bacterium]|nr:30S ribosomal protein S1 [Acidobacteriota bacterium]
MADLNNTDNEITNGGEFEKSNSFSESKGTVEIQDENLEFEKLLDMYDNTAASYDEGEVVMGKVIKITDSEVIVDIGYKSEGVIPKQEFLRPDGSISINIGDEVEVLIVMEEDQDGRIHLSHSRAASMKIWDRIEAAHRDEEVITGKVLERVKGGLAVDVGIRAFLPGSLIDTHPIRNLDSFIGEEIDVKVIKVNKKRGNIVLSRKVIIDEENKHKREETLKTLKEGDITKGIVKNITSYGAFVDLGGIDGLLHITDMSWGRITHPSELFVVGDEVEVKVLAFDKEGEKVSLGYKQKTDDPWEGIAEKYPVSAKVKGKVTSITDYGAFISLEEGIEGLVHVSEMSWDKKVKHPSKIVGVGDIIETVVLEIDQDNRKISLGLKQIEPNPWEKIAEKYEIGSLIEGTVRNLTSFGAFVEIEEGIDGLIHLTDISYTKRINHPSEVVKKGDVIKARILNIDPENQQISLGLKQLTSEAWDDFFTNHEVGDLIEGKVTRITTFGAFVEVAQDVEGLIHVSELDTKKIDKPEDVLVEGQSYSMKIINLDRDEKKIGLSIKAIIMDEKKKARKKKPKPKKEKVQKTKTENKEGTINIGDLVGDQLSSLRGLTSKASPAQEEETPAKDVVDEEQQEEKEETAE